jgi:hypothetical protein
MALKSGFSQSSHLLGNYSENILIEFRENPIICSVPIVDHKKMTYGRKNVVSANGF